MTTTDTTSAAGLIGGEQSIELLAGQHPNGEHIVERVLVSVEASSSGTQTSYRLLKSPLFVRGIARADIIAKMSEPKGAFTVLQNGGNLCIRVFCKSNIDALEQSLTPALEKLDGDLDIKEPGALVYSIHVSSGFTAIEKILNDKVQAHSEAAWFYGNVYDPASGEPLNWWQSILAPE